MLRLNFIQRFLLVATAIITFSFLPPTVPEGAWQYQHGSTTEMLVLKDGYLTHSIYDIPNKKFIGSRGGPFSIVRAGELSFTIEFDTRDIDLIGTKNAYVFREKGTGIETDMNGSLHTFSLVDNGSATLAGLWRITGRVQDGKMNEMKRGDRKTLKIISGNRFQWMAINPATKEFFGTGGGTYTFENGKYTEHIEFFSRDSSRVGAKLMFDGEVTGKRWKHSGKSSKGEPLEERWEREQ